MRETLRMLLLFTALCITQGGFAQVIKLGTVAPEGSPWYDAMREVAESWRKLSNGRIKVRIYPGGVAGDEMDMIRKIRVGQLHGAALTSSGTAYINYEICALTNPLNITTDDELDYVIKKVGPYIEKKIKEKGFQVLGWSNIGWVHFFSKRPVVTPDDMRKRKLFFWGSETTYVELLKKSGFHPIPLSVTDLQTSLQTGLVDSFAAPPQAALAFQWYSQAPYMSEFKWQPLPAIVVLSNRAWDRIPANLRPELLKSAGGICKKLNVRIKKMEKESIEAMEKHGLKVEPTPEKVIQEWKKLVEKDLYPVFIGKRYSKVAFDKVQKALKEYRAQQGKKEKGAAKKK